MKKRFAAATLIQKFARAWLSRHAFLQFCAAVLTIQCCIRGIAVRKNIKALREESAAIFLQAQWRMWKAYSFFLRYKHAVVSIQCIWRRKLAKREFLKLRKEAREAGVLREQKNKLERNLEDVNLRLQLEKIKRVSVEESRMAEIARLQKTLVLLTSELDNAKSIIINESNKNTMLCSQMEKFKKDKEALTKDLIRMKEIIKENMSLKSSEESLNKKNSQLKQELFKTQKSNKDFFEKLEIAETKYSQLQCNIQSLEEKLLNKEEENHVLRQKMLSVTSLNHNHAGLQKSTSEKNSIVPVSSEKDHKNIYETPPSGKFSYHSRNISSSRRLRMAVEVHEDHHEILLRSIKEDLGFKDGKPIAACVIYKLLIHWHSFEAERTSLFDHIIEGINDVIKVSTESDILPYWLSNASALLCLLQKNLRSNGFLKTPVRHSISSPGTFQRITNAIKSPLDFISSEDSFLYVEARYPAILFKQQLTACLEKIYGLIRDNLKKEISPLLSLCIQAPKTTRTPASRSFKSPSSTGAQQQLSSHWDSIIDFLDSLMIQLRQNHVTI